MLDVGLVRKDPGGVAARLRQRGFELDVDALERLEADRKSVQTRTEELQARRNALSKQIGQLKSKGEDASAVMAEVAAMPDTLKNLEGQLATIQERLRDLLLNAPNLPHPDTPVGKSETDNVEVRRVGTPR